eukprot:2496333-Pyramimonas_sp.AAC.1
MAAMAGRAGGASPIGALGASMGALGAFWAALKSSCAPWGALRQFWRRGEPPWGCLGGMLSDLGRAPWTALGASWT